MNKRVLVASLLMMILGLLTAFFLFLQRRQERLEEKRILTYASGESLYQEGKHAQAIVQFREVIERFPGSRESRKARYWIARSLAGLENYKGAENYLRGFLKDFPESDYTDRVYYRLGWLKEIQGDSDEALSFYGEVMALSPRGSMADEAILGQGRIQAARGKWKLAREAFEKIIDDFSESNSFLPAREELGELNMELIFSSTQTEDSLAYEVKDGDSLYSIAKKFNTTVSLLMKSNRLKSPAIRPRQTLKIVPGNYRLVIDKSEITLSLYLNDRLIKVYPVGIGIEDDWTPTGEFKIVNKLINPDWYAPHGRRYPYGDHRNILGSRWMGISLPGYGIHGTTQPETIGKRLSQGCIRMFNEDVEELYDLVTPGTPVIVKE